MSFDINQVKVEVFNQKSPGLTQHACVSVDNKNNDACAALKIVYSRAGSKNKHEFVLQDLDAGKVVEAKVAAFHGAFPHNIKLHEIVAEVDGKTFSRAPTLCERSPMLRKLANMVGFNR